MTTTEKREDNKAIFVDANILLHCMRPSQIDWLSIFEAKSVTIIICKSAFDEVEKQKYGEKHKIKERAQSVSKEIKDLLKDAGKDLIVEIRENVHLRLYPHVARQEYYGSLKGLAASDGDDRIFATIFQLKDDEKPQAELIFASSDSGVFLKGKFLEIKVVDLPQACHLTSEVDPHQKRIADLSAELARYKAKEPRISLAFTTQQNSLEVRKRPGIARDSIDLRMLTIKDHYKTSEFYLNLRTQRYSYLTISTSSSQFRRYDEYIAKFHDSYCEYLAKLDEYEDFINDLLELELVLNNLGTIAAEGVEIFLRPKDLNAEWFLNEEQLPIKPVEPKSPITFEEYCDKPSMLFDDLLSKVDFSRSLSIPKFIDPSLPQIETDSTKKTMIVFRVRTVMHNQATSLRKLYIQGSRLEQRSGFSVEVNVHAKNMAEPFRGQLNLRVLQ